MTPLPVATSRLRSAGNFAKDLRVLMLVRPRLIAPYPRTSSSPYGNRCFWSNTIATWRGGDCNDANGCVSVAGYMN